MCVYAISLRTPESQHKHTKVIPYDEFEIVIGHEDRHDTARFHVFIQFLTYSRCVVLRNDKSMGPHECTFCCTKWTMTFCEWLKLFSLKKKIKILFNKFL